MVAVHCCDMMYDSFVVVVRLYYYKCQHHLDMVDNHVGFAGLIDNCAIERILVQRNLNNYYYFDCVDNDYSVHNC